MSRIVLALMSIVSMLFIGEPASFAQVGSVGGTIGKTDKSASGGAEQINPVRRAREAPARESAISRCLKIVGTWNWDPIGETVFGRDGFVRHSIGTAGTWRCNGETVFAVWNSGITDHITVAADGNTVVVTNSNGKTFSATRK